VAVNLDFLGHPERSGIFNLGTGRAQSFNDVAVATVNACRRAEGRPPATLAELVREGAIEYVAFPPQLVGKYQSYTQADLTLLRAAGCKVEMAPVEAGVAGYVERLMADGGASPVT